MRPTKLERGKKISTLPDPALNLLLSSPRGLDRLLADLEAPVQPSEIEKAEYDRVNCGERFE